MFDNELLVWLAGALIAPPEKPTQIEDHSRDIECTEYEVIEDGTN